MRAREEFVETQQWRLCQSFVAWLDFKSSKFIYAFFMQTATCVNLKI